MKRININPIFRVGEVVVKSGVRPDSYSNSWKQDKSKAEETSIIGTDHALRGKHHLFFFLFQLYISALKRFLFAWNLKIKIWKPVLKQKNQNLALSNKRVGRLLRQVVGSKVGTVWIKCLKII